MRRKVKGERKKEKGESQKKMFSHKDSQENNCSCKFVICRFRGQGFVIPTRAISKPKLKIPFSITPDYKSGTAYLI
ncbi:hypothetical protein BZG02_15270 [Labilibaculum filiforme]|uniref:Uncharacterized protein n=1 Tax=Labilibaculum filiforme TaxID=1940526 RepID=A0A2N3HU31_9BACT|nr:hypothetical protein BZG02_15270 [Labilibaculum filiforme]